MPRRVYGSAGTNNGVVSNGNKRVRVMLPEQKSEISIDEKQVTKSNFNLFQSMYKYRKPILVFFVSAIVLCFLSFLSWTFIFDSGHGGSSAEDVSSVYYKSLIRRSDDIWRCLPKVVRDKQFAASDTMWIYSPAFENCIVKDFDVISQSERDISSSIDVLKKNFSDFYDADISIDEAKVVTYIGTLDYSEDNSDGRSETAFDVICFRHGVRWYVFTAGTDGLTDVDTIPDVRSSDSFVPSDLDDESMPFSYDVPAVKTYSDALSDLQSGTFEADGNDYIVPDTYSSFSSLFCLEDDLIDKKDRVISHGKVLTELPVSFINTEYTGADISVDIANINASDADISEGVVNSIYIGKKVGNNGKYPRIILPGNITIGTSKTAVEYVYGNLFKYKNLSGLPEYISEMCEQYNMSVYYIDCNNKHNKICFIFDENASLMGIYWSYYDLRQIS